MCLFTFETFLNIVGHILLVQKQDLYLTSYSEYEICNIFFSSCEENIHYTPEGARTSSCITEGDNYCLPWF